MNTTSSQTTVLEQWLPDAVVVSDLKNLIDSDASGQVELDSGTITIPSDTNYELVSKAFIEQRYDVGFGSCFRVVVAVGGVSSIEAGVIRAKYGFCTLWYSKDRTLITTDFSTEAFG
jgi:hypothetical protein